MFYDVLKVIFYLGIMVLIFWMAKKGTSLYAGYASKLQSSKYMRIIDKLSLGKDSAIGIVQIGEQYFLIGINGGKTNILREIDKDDLQEIRAEMPNIYDGIQKKFSGLFSQKEKNRSFSELFREKAGKSPERTDDDILVDELLTKSQKQAMKFKKRIFSDEGGQADEDK